MNKRFNLICYDSCPMCGKTGDNLMSNGASGRSGRMVGDEVVVDEVVVDEVVVDEDTPGNLTGFHYRCKKCDVWFTSKQNLPHDNIIVYSAGPGYTPNPIKSPDTVIIILEQDYEITSIISVTNEKGFPKIKEKYMEEFRRKMELYKEMVFPTTTYVNIEEFDDGNYFGIKYDVNISTGLVKGNIKYEYNTYSIEEN